MAKYLLISSRDPFESNEVPRFYEMAAGLKKEGNEVSVLLVQNGVLPARKSSRSDLLANLKGAGVELLCDEFSLRERGIGKDRLVEGIQVTSLDTVIDHLEEGRKVLFS